MKKYFFAIIPALLFASCGNKTYRPIYASKPIIATQPDYKLEKERSVPQDESLTLVFSLKENAEPKEDDYFNNPGAKKTTTGRAPSVIIAPPKEIEISGEKVKEFGQRNNVATGDDDLEQIFRTDGYYNEAEQVIEKALLKIGFNVLDRSKFEAKLRDLRDRANEKPWWYNDWTERLLESGEYDVLKEQYKKQLQEGVITPGQYAEIINEVDKQSQRGLPGKKREEDEMNDIAEVIRAAQTGADQADYLLQINDVTVIDAGDRYLNIREYDEVKEFMGKHHGLKFGDLPRALPSSISSKWLRASFNAKLIEIKTGSIVWIGSHDIESAAAEPIEISIDIDKNISNEDDVNGDIQLYNRSLEKQDRKLKSLAVELDALYAEALLEKKMKSSEDVDVYTKELGAKIKSKEADYNESLKIMNDLLSTPPITSSKNWEYTYDVSTPIIYPNLLSIGKKDIKGKQRLLQHRKELIQKVTMELIKTIEIN